jgi:hypothetical protein
LKAVKYSITFAPMKGLFVILCLFPLFTFGQFLPDSLTVSDRKKPTVDVTFGTAFLASKYGSSYGFFVSPRISYPLTNRFTLGVGGLFRSYSPLSGIEDPAGSTHPFHSTQMQSLLMVEGAYQVNDKLTLTGLVYREIPVNNIQLQNRRIEAKGMIMGIDYRVNDHVFIRGQVEISNNRYPYYSDPFINPHRGRQFDPFFQGLR